MSAEPETSRPTLDLRAAQNRLSGNERLLKELAQFLVDDVPDLLNRLSAAIEVRDRANAAHAAHRLSSLAATFGVSPTMAVAAEVESAARCGNLSEAKRHQPELRRQFQVVVEVLQDEVLDAN